MHNWIIPFKVNYLFQTNDTDKQKEALKSFEEDFNNEMYIMEVMLKFLRLDDSNKKTLYEIVTYFMMKYYSRLMMVKNNIQNLPELKEDIEAAFDRISRKVIVIDKQMSKIE